MGTPLTLEYDSPGDILYLDLQPPQDAQVMRELAPGVLVREDTNSKRLLGIEIHGFVKRAAGDAGLSLPLVASFTLAEAGIA